MTNTAIDQLINHIALVLDASTSMQKHSKKVIEVANSVIADLATMSSDFNQETRVTIYQFGDEIKCLVYDKDVLRLPKISDLYKIGGNTALMAATVKSIDDLMLQPQIYGDHAFWDTVITDGQENTSYRHGVTVDALKRKLSALQDNWTLATLVPDQRGIRDAVAYGFPKENCGIWDASSVTGFEGAGQTYQTAAKQFFTNRSKGIRQTTGVFTLRTDVLNPSVIKASLNELYPWNYTILPVSIKSRIDQFVSWRMGTFKLGSAYYQLMKPEIVQAQKEVCVRDKRTGKVFGGRQTRGLLGLPNETVKVYPDRSPNYDIFVQSTAPNRNLVANTELLVMGGV